jgi:hypothetical protein
MRIFLFVVLIALFPAVSTAVAQTEPTVEIVLSQPTAQQGDTVMAEVWVRDAYFVGGIDIGMRVDENCLRILDRQPGGYLPTTDAEGAFSALSVIEDHETRLASALADRTKHASGDGVFYRVQLEATCQAGTAALDIFRAQISTYIDPEAEIIDLINYELDKDTLNIINAQLAIGPVGQVTAVPTATRELLPTQTSAPAPEADAVRSNLVVIALLCLVSTGIALLLMAFWLVRRNRKR